VGNQLSVAADLPKGRYYARVRARNAVGTSPSSNEAAFRVGTRLASPTAFTVVWQGTQATMSWTPSSADSPDRVPSNYILEAGSAPGLSDVATVPLGNVSRFTVNIPAGAYYVRLRAVNANGDSDPTPDLVVAAPGTAQAPRTLAAGGSGPMVDLSWTPPASGETPLGYIIEAGSEPGLANLARMQVGNMTRFSTPAPPGTYFVRVRAVNSRGPGLPSNEVVVQK
jgi:predicted phage tail protein